jgi:hypothetical protein
LNNGSPPSPNGYCGLSSAPAMNPSNEVDKAVKTLDISMLVCVKELDRNLAAK